MTASERITEIIKYYGVSANTLSKRIGLDRPQAIYDIMGGKTKSITDKMGMKIISVFPEISKSWLLSGEGMIFPGPYDRINVILRREGLSQRDFARGAGNLSFIFPIVYKNAQNNPGDIKILESWTDYLLKLFPKYSKEWIMYGEGEMIKQTISVEPNHEFPLKTDRNVLVQDVPLYDFDASAGLVAIFNDIKPEPMDYLHIPNLPLVDGAIYVRGDSMSPLLKSGDIVMYKTKELSIDSIIWGEIYLLSFTTDGDSYTAVKYIRKSEKPGMVCLTSFNPAFAPKDIPMESITALALVKASLTFHTME